MTKVIPLFLTLLCTVLIFGQTTQDVNEQVKELVNDSSLKNASISFFAVDMESGEVISAIEEHKSLVPASTMKLVTTATALELLGPNHRFRTELLYTGHIDSNGILHGDIIIKGGGDPCLGSHRFTKRYGDFIGNWTNTIVKLGVDSITGGVVADASYFDNQIPSTWVWGDLGNYYGAGPSGLSVYENFCTLELASGESPGDTTVIKSVTPYIPDLFFENEVKSWNTNSDKSYILGAPYQNNRFIRGGIPLNQQRFKVKGSIPDPAFLVAFQLNDRLVKNKVKVAHPAQVLDYSDKVSPQTKKRSITTLHSPKLIDIIHKTNTHSINLYAEHLMCHIGKLNGEGGLEEGVKATSQFWNKKGVDVNGLHIYDGSGLSRFNAMNAKQLVGVLTYMSGSKYANLFRSTLPVAGETGTLRTVGQGTVAEGRVRAKSGYMTRVRSYAGFVNTLSGRNIAFAIIANNYNCSAYQMKKKIEKVMIKLAEISD